MLKHFITRSLVVWKHCMTWRILSSSSISKGGLWEADHTQGSTRGIRASANLSLRLSIMSLVDRFPFFWWKKIKSMRQAYDSGQQDWTKMSVLLFWILKIPLQFKRECLISQKSNKFRPPRFQEVWHPGGISLSPQVLRSAKTRTFSSYDCGKVKMLFESFKRLNFSANSPPVLVIAEKGTVILASG